MLQPEGWGLMRQGWMPTTVWWWAQYLRVFRRWPLLKPAPLISRSVLPPAHIKRKKQKYPTFQCHAYLDPVPEMCAAWNYGAGLLMLECAERSGWMLQNHTFFVATTACWKLRLASLSFLCDSVFDKPPYIW